MAGESAHQCGPCAFGLPALAGDLEELCDGGRGAARRPRASSRAPRRVDRGPGRCRHPDGVVRLVRSALEVFGADAARHARALLPGQPLGPPLRAHPARPVSRGARVKHDTGFVLRVDPILLRRLRTLPRAGPGPRGHRRVGIPRRHQPPRRRCTTAEPCARRAWPCAAVRAKRSPSSASAKGRAVDQFDAIAHRVVNVTADPVRESTRRGGSPRRPGPDARAGLA